MFLYDTVALSEAFLPKRDPGFEAWARDVSDRHIYTSVLCIGEIWRGVANKGERPGHDALLAWVVHGLPAEVGGRVLSVDARVAEAWGRLGMRGKAKPIDALIGCTAVVHGLSVVTRNERDFAGLGVSVVNPWIRIGD